MPSDTSKTRLRYLAILLGAIGCAGGFVIDAYSEVNGLLVAAIAFWLVLAAVAVAWARQAWGHLGLWLLTFISLESCRGLLASQYRDLAENHMFGITAFGLISDALCAILVVALLTSVSPSPRVRTRAPGHGWIAELACRQFMIFFVTAGVCLWTYFFAGRNGRPDTFVVIGIAAAVLAQQGLMWWLGLPVRWLVAIVGSGATVAASAGYHMSLWHLTYSPTTQRLFVGCFSPESYTSTYTDYSLRPPMWSTVSPEMAGVLTAVATAAMMTLPVFGLITTWLIGRRIKQHFRDAATEVAEHRDDLPGWRSSDA